MSRFIRNTVVLAAIETTYGVDVVPTGAANAILLSNPSFKLNVNNVKRDLVRPFFGNSEELSGTKSVEAGLDVELVGSGTAGDAPAWSPLIRACAMLETIQAGIRVDYTPVTDGQESVSAYIYRSGVLHKALGARSKLTIGMKQGEIPKLKMQMVGLYGGISASAPSGVDYSAFETPQVVTDTNSTEIVIGATVNTVGAPVVSGGTSYPTLGLEMDFGLEVPLTALVGGETIDVTDRRAVGKITIDVTAAQEVSIQASVLANTVQAITFVHGTVAGKKVMAHLPSCQFVNPVDEELNGRLLKTYDLVMVPVAGNDEIRIVLF